jgi:endonuclease YncB( thermonuclease family)
MGEAKTLTTGRYSKLVADVKKLIEEGKTRAQRAASVELARTYWEVGQRIVEENLTGSANYGESVMEDLAEDLDTDVRTLQYCVAFAKIYSKFPDNENLGWSHYKMLLGVRDDKARSALETQAEKEGWTREQLAKAVAEAQETAESGEPGGSRKGAKRLERPTEPSFVYKAFVEHVVDGDTLELRIDLGFYTAHTASIRLAGVDAMPVEDEEGREAYEYIRDQMAKASLVVVKTHQIDKYHRYLGHVFYTFDTKANRDKVFAEGRYLNQELLDKGLARLI